MNQRLETVILGSGINGLARAMKVQRHARGIPVYEQSEQLEGMARKGRNIESGFHNDWADKNPSLIASQPLFQVFGDVHTRFWFFFGPVQKHIASASPDGSWLGTSNEAELNAARVEKLSLTVCRAWKTMLAAFLGWAEQIFAILGTPFRLFPFAKTLRRLWRKEGLGGSFDLMRLLSRRPQGDPDESAPFKNLYHTGAVFRRRAGTVAGTDFLLGSKLPS